MKKQNEQKQKKDSKKKSSTKYMSSLDLNIKPFNEYDDLMWKIINRVYIRSVMTKMDIYQEFYLVYVRCVKYYPNTGGTFLSYFEKACEKQLGIIMKKVIDTQTVEVLRKDFNNISKEDKTDE